MFDFELLTQKTEKKKLYVDYFSNVQCCFPSFLYLWTISTQTHYEYLKDHNGLVLLLDFLPAFSVLLLCLFTLSESICWIRLHQQPTAFFTWAEDLWGSSRVAVGLSPCFGSFMCVKHLWYNVEKNNWSVSILQERN